MRRAASLGSIALLGLACSSTESTGGAADAASDAPFAIPDGSGAAHLEAGSLADVPKGPRVTNHGGKVLASMSLFAIYLTNKANAGAAPSQDDFLQWVLSAPGYWSKVLGQYGVGDGSFLGSATFPITSIVDASKISGGLVGKQDFADGVGAFLNGPDAGALPRADAYAFFLPDGVNVVFPDNGGITCTTAAGYHHDDGLDPFAVFAPCGAGRGSFTLSHELAEMATDPLGKTWFSDADQGNGGGEVGDLCEQDAFVDGRDLTELWSNADDGCAW